MKCDSGQLAAHALGILDEAQAKAVERHAETCPSCARELARLRETAALLETMPELESEPMDMERLWSMAASRRPVADRLTRVRKWAGSKHRWAISLAAAACLAVLFFHYGVSLQVGRLRIAFGDSESADPVSQEIVAVRRELARHVARQDELAMRVERTLVGLAYAVNDLDTGYRRDLVGLHNELTAQRTLDQTAIRKSFSLVTSEMTDAFRGRQ